MARMLCLTQRSSACWLVLSAFVLTTACQTTVKFEGARLSTADPGPTHMIHGLLAKPEGNGPFPAVILLPTCGGLRPHVTQFWPGYLTRLGYVTLTVDSLGARGLRGCTPDLQGAGQELTRDAYGALDYLAGLPFVDRERVAVMGFSLGAHTVSYFVGRNITSPSGLNFKAAIMMYPGGCGLIGPSDRMIPLAVVIGDKDREIAVSTCTRLASQSSVRVDVLRDTYHAFDQPEVTSLRYDIVGSPMLYSATATKRAQEITKEFLASHLGQ
jgi:dienelactone hydrolase